MFCFDLLWQRADCVLSMLGWGLFDRGFLVVFISCFWVSLAYFHLLLLYTFSLMVSVVHLD